MKILTVNSNKNTGIWKIVEKETSTLSRKINSTNYETVALKGRFNAFTISNNQFQKVTKDKKIDDNARIDKGFGLKLKDNLTLPSQEIK